MSEICYSNKCQRKTISSRTFDHGSVIGTTKMINWLQKKIPTETKILHVFKSRMKAKKILTQIPSEVDYLHVFCQSMDNTDQDIQFNLLKSPNTIDPGVMISIDSLYNSLAFLSLSMAFITSSTCLASL